MSRFPRRCVVLSFALLLACTAATGSAAADDETATTITGRVIDEAGNPVAGADVEFHRWSDPVGVATSDAEGRITLEVPAGSSWLIAECEHAERLAYQQINEVTDAIELELVLKPARMIEVATALAGEPVADVIVEVHAGSRPLATGLTDADGKCRLAFPRDAFVQTVLAFKREVGFAGYQRDDDYQSLVTDNTPDAYTFELMPAGRITARVQDRLRRPLARVTVYASSVQWPDEHISFGSTASVRLTTDENGEAVFDFLPEDVFIISFGAIVGEDYHLVSRASWRPGAGNLVELEAWLKAPVSGTVFNIDGMPAAGIQLAIDGDLAQRSSFRERVVTDDEGRYSFRAPPDHAFVVGVNDPQSAAKSITGVISVDDGSRLDGHDLQLIEGTRFHGSVRLDDGSPLSESTLSLIENVEIQYVTLNGEQVLAAPRLIRQVEVDEAGNFSTLLGPGSYQASCLGGRSARTAFFTFEVVDEAEVQHDFVLESIHQEELIGRVLRVVDGTLQPVAGITVDAVPCVQRGPPFLTAVTNENGEFLMTLEPCKLQLHVLSDDGAWGVTRVVEGTPEQLELVLLPTTTASGQVVDQRGPVAGFPIEYRIRIDYGGGHFSPRFGGDVETDDEGRFTLPDLIQGQEYHCTHFHSNTLGPVADVTAIDSTPVDLGQLEYTSGRSRTPIERMRDYFLSSEDAQLHLDTALSDARLQRQDVLVIVGGQKDERVRDLFRLFFKQYDEWDPRGDSPLRQRLHDYELCGLSPEHLDDVERLDDASIAAAASEGPVLLVLDADAGMLGQLPAGDFVAADQTLDESAIHDFLESHRPEELDAERLLEEALAAAAANDPARVIVVHEVDTFLPSSRRLSRLFQQHAETLEAHFVYFPVDPARMAQGHTLLDAIERERSPQDYGQKIPGSWVGLLSAEGELLDSVRFQGDGMGIVGTEVTELFYMISLYGPGVTQDELTAWRESFLSLPVFGNPE